MNRLTRLLAILLAFLMLLYCGVSAAEPTSEAGEGSAAEPIEEPVKEPVITLSASLSDEQVVNNPNQILAVTALEDDTPMDAARIQVKLGDSIIAAAEDGYHLTLSRGDNQIEIDAGGKTLSLCVRYEIAIPDGWSKKALTFCVEQGILSGDKNGDLTPKASASRAQLAAMLVRLFQAEPSADLSGYQDVSASAWYYKELSKAVAMGIFEGSNGTLTPNSSITREQAFTVLSRAFGVAAFDLSSLDAFPDKSDVSGWARYNVAGMLEAGFVHGNTKGLLNPKGYITREELAQVLYNALDTITDDPEALTGKRNLYTGDPAKLAGRTVSGDLILSCDCPEALTLPDFTVEGRLVLYLHGAKTVTMGKVSSNVSVCCPIDLTLTESVDELVLLRDGAAVHGKAKDVITLADCTLDGTYGTVYCHGGNPTIAEGAAVQYLVLDSASAGLTATVNGAVTNSSVYAKRQTIEGTGSIGTLYRYGVDCTASCQVGTDVDRVDAGLKGISVNSGESPKVYYDNLTTTVTGTVTGVDTEQVFGVDGGVRLCSVTYRYKGKVVKTEENFALTEGAELSCTFTAELQYKVEAEQSVSVTITYGEESYTGSLKFIGTGRYTDYTLAKEVRTVRVCANILYATTIYARSNYTNPVTTLAAGTEVYYVKYEDDCCLVETRSGVKGYCRTSSVRVSWQNYHNDSVSYSDGVKEAFVNELHTYSSPTNYLIWINLYTTTVNIFEGSKGNWKLIKSSECTIGAPNTPTRPGVYSIYAHSSYWSFDSNGVDDVTRCYYASLFDGGIATHTRLYYTGTSNMVNSALSAELSHGCVRCPDDIAKYIYYQCPTGTTVVVY